MFEQLNISIFNAINHLAKSNIILDKFGIILAKYMPIIFVLFMIYLWFRESNVKNIVLYSGYSSIVGIALNFSIGLFYFHPRPFMEHIGKLLISHAPETSFPSDHTTFMLSIAFTFLYFKRTRIPGVILSLLGITGGVARVFCGLHFPFDIVGSIFVAVLTSFVVYFLRERFKSLNEYILKIDSMIYRRRQ